MWLKSLHLENFRGFERLDVEFDERCTLLLGENAAGKTAVLEAIVVAFGAFFAKIVRGPTKGIETSDARRVVYHLEGIPDLQEQWPVSVGATAKGLDIPDVLAEPPVHTVGIHWTRVREERAGRTARANEGEIRRLGERMQDAVQAGHPIELPLVAYYGTQRLWREKRQSRGKQGVGNRLDGYVDCLDIASSERFLHDWMRQRTLEELQLRGTDPSYRHPQLAAVVAAVANCIDGATRFWFDLQHDEIRLARAATIESFEMLSDGYRNMVAMVADIAERAAVLNPHFGAEAARTTSGVVLIDELELHLHPRWQRTVVSSLSRTFPKLQFIATTHSPQVVSTVERTQVRLFADNHLVDATVFVAGRDANELLEDIFRVPARPPETQREVDALFRLLDLEEYDAARAKLTELQVKLGPDDAAIVKARWLLDTAALSEPLPPATS